MKELVILLALAVALVGVTACGGDDNGSEQGSDEAEIRAVIAAGNSKDPAICDKLTDKWMRNVVGGDRADCKQQVKDSPEDAVEVERVSVEGDQATVTAQIQGDAGTLLLVKEGDEWKLDDIQQAK